MINFAKIFGNRFVGTILRKSLTFIPDSAVMPIVQGKLKGKKWIKGAGVNGYWLGTYEIEHQRKISELLKPGNVFWDIGAHVGYFSLLASSLVGPDGKVYAFEPFARNAALLQKHIELNSINNVQLLELAVADKVGQASFQESDKSSMGKISTAGTTVVKTTTIDDLVFNQKLTPPTLIKIDVEGLQDEVLLGGLKTLETYHPSILVEADYNPKDTRNFFCTLTQLGYEVKPLVNPSLEGSGDYIATYKLKS